MATVLVSPGVVTREIDGTIRPADPQGVTPVFIAPRQKGPAFNPIVIKDQDEDAMMFGLPKSDGKDFGAYTNRAYLREQHTPSTMMRILGLSDTGINPGYTVGGTYAILASGSEVVALIQASGTVSLVAPATGSVDSLLISITDRPGGNVTASLNRNDANYIKKVLNTDPTQYGTQKHMVFAVYDFANKTPSVDGAFAVAQVVSSTSWQDEYITGSTTTVISQPFGSVEYDLFGVGNRFAGDSANEEIKVSIADIKKSPNETLQPYGSFTVQVRRFIDNDKSPQVLEQFPNCNLNPDSPNYVVRRIGDRYKVWNSTQKKFEEFGDYPNRSNYIYIVPSTDLKNRNSPDTALPWGFKGYRLPTSGAVSDKAAFPAMPYVSDLLYKSVFNTKVYWGVEVINNASGALNHGIVDKLKHLPTALLAASGTTDTKFSLKYVSGATSLVSGYAAGTRLGAGGISAMSTSIGYNTAVTEPTGGSDGYLSVANIENTILAKFTLPMADGFDGLDITKSNPFDPVSDMSSVTTYQTHAYRTAIDMISNPDEFDFSTLALPGVHASLVTDYALDMVENRGDMFYIMDASGSTVDAVISDVDTKNLDTNYAAVYYPWLRYNDDVNNKIVEIPPTVIMPAVFARNDRLAFQWYAPAGFVRGGLRSFGVTEAKDKLTATDRDRLYENRINPIATFPSQGTVVWGQKTLQIAASALDRINVRRMLLFVRKVLARESLNIVFEPNVSAVWQRLVNRIQPTLERVRENFGIDDFRIILDNRTTTQDLIERNIIFGKIAIKPTRTSEFVYLDFFLTNNVAGFEEG